ncbi:WD40 repeat domain-containing protein [Streptomyces sp. NPDC006739]|uniref:WD40 repeat domain-containing protein n=1 Tax=Streptomyces sp. NPDC006739 TaxID=3364763 RepID=UPI003674B7FF
MDTGTRTGRVIALLSRRAPAFEPRPGAPRSPAEGYYRARRTRQATTAAPLSPAYPAPQAEAGTDNDEATVVGAQRPLQDAQAAGMRGGRRGVVALLTALITCAGAVVALLTVNAPESIEGVEGSLAALALSPDGKVIASTTSPSSIRLRSTTTGDTLATIKDPGLVRTLSISPDSRILAAGDAGGTVRLWDLTTPDKPSSRGVLTSEGHGHVGSLAFTSDGTALTVTYERDTAALWDVRTGRAVKFLALPGLTASAVTGRMLATADYHGTVRLWSLTEPRDPVQVSSFTTEADHDITGLALGPDSGVLAVAGYEGDVQLYDITKVHRPARIQTPQIRGHDGVVTMAFGPDNHALAIAYEDGAILVASGTLYSEITSVGEEDVTALTFDHTGRLLQGIDHGGVLHAWNVAGS